MSQTLAAEAHETVVLDRRAQRNILTAMCMALVAVMASVSGLNVAQRELATHLGASQSDVLWIINGFTLTLAALLMPIGAIGDRWGRKPVLLAGLGLFTIANISGMVVQSTGLMIASRVIAGAGAAMIMPVTLSVLTSSFPPAERSRAIAIWAGFAGSGGLIGLFASSFTLDVLTWRYSFVLPLLLGLVSAAITVAVVPNSVESNGHPFDTVGSVLSALAIGGIVLGVHEGPVNGWTDSLTLFGLVAGALCLIGFVLWELRQEHPLLDVTAFRDRSLAAGTLTMMLLFAVMFGVFLVVFPYFQIVIGWSALRSSVGLLPMAAAMMSTSTLALKVAARIGSRSTMMFGAVTFGVGLATLALRASVSGGYLAVLPGLVIMGVGMGFSMTPATSAITETLPHDKQGVASALNDTSREVGGALGVALLGSVLSTGYRTSITPLLDGVPAQLAEPAKAGIGNAFGVAQIPEAKQFALQIMSAAKTAFVDAWVQSIWVGVGLAGVAVAYLVLRGPRRVHSVDDGLQ